jgi:group II intron reverse transcriptase/maturase
MHANEESDALVVAKKLPNSRVTPEEATERRSATNGKTYSAKRSPDAEPGKSAHAPEWVGQRASKDKETQFTNLLSHVNAALLKEAYQRLRKQAASGVDGETWQSYGEQLDGRLHDLERRVQRGSYHPRPVRRVHIPKADGKLRPLGITAIEDKVVQQAVRMLMEPIYENSAFLGFSYGFRPNRSPHRALDALAVAIGRKVNWVLDADIRSFFDMLDHDWMRRFIEHRIADKRLVRLLMKWLRAGVMEEGRWINVEKGSPQGAIISPLLANIYLHYALDLWIHQWRKRAHGDVYIVRYADDLVMGFQYERDARAMRSEIADRLARFGLELHPDKTRVLRFGRHAELDPARDGRTRPETFDFLGFTHVCAKDRRGRFALRRRTARKKRQSKLAALREEIRRRRHEPVKEQFKWLTAVLRGHVNYYGVPGNYRSLANFRHHVRDEWHRSLQRRSQRARWSREQQARFERRFTLPKPRIVHPWPSERFVCP